MLKIKKKDFGDIKFILIDFYLSTISSLPENEQLPTRIFIEEGLIFEKEKRRLRLFEKHIIENFKIKKETLEKLVNSRLIRTELNENGEYFYELSNDEFIEPILFMWMDRIMYRIPTEEEARLEAEEHEKLRIEKIMITKKE